MRHPKCALFGRLSLLPLLAGMSVAARWGIRFLFIQARRLYLYNANCGGNYNFGIAAPRAPPPAPLYTRAEGSPAPGGAFTARLYPARMVTTSALRLRGGPHRLIDRPHRERLPGAGPSAPFFLRPAGRTRWEHPSARQCAAECSAPAPEPPGGADTSCKDAPVPTVHCSGKALGS